MRTTVFAALAALGLMACGGGEARTPTFRQATAEFTTAAISWDFEDESVDWTLEEDEGDPPRCVLLYQSNFPQTPEPDATALFGPWLECTRGEHFLDIGLPGHLDLRDLGVGEETFADGDDEFPVVYFSVGNTVCELAPTEMVATRDVIEATGEALPYPELVSEDYRRVIRFSFETGEVDGTLRDGSGSCSGAASVDVTIEQTTEHYVTKDAFAEG